MASTTEDKVKEFIGRLVVENASLASRLEAAEEKIKELEAKQVGHNS